MVTPIRLAIAKQLADGVTELNSSLGNTWHEHLKRVAWCIRPAAVSKKSNISHPTFKVSYEYLERCKLLNDSPWHYRRKLCNQLASEMTKSKYLSLVNGVEAEDKALKITIEPVDFNKCLLQNIFAQQSKYGFDSKESLLYNYEPGNAVKQWESKRVVVEFSSPNIAKRFHAGHLRSTILGNFVANVHKELGHDVHKINYLGDWGTQFGLLGVAFQEYGSMQKLKENAMQHLFDIYVKVNREVAKEKSDEKTDVYQKGLDFFKRMENGDAEALSLWKMCRDFSIEEYSAVYKRLGVQFDEYNSEAEYFEKSVELVKKIREKGLLKIESTTGVGYLDLSEEAGKPLTASLLKSDGSSLYLTRDIVAAIERFEKQKFDKMYYVVENGQHKHFERLVYSLQQLDHKWAYHPVNNFHLKFGRVEGMSSRKGEVVFLTDILDEARNRMVNIMKEKNTTKVHDSTEAQSVADKLGISAIIVQDLKEKRQRNYEFRWDRMLSFTGDTGVFLQYTHARLCSLESNCDVELNADCDFNVLTEPQAQKLLLHLARFEDVMYEAYTDLEPCYIVQYLFKLGRLVNSALEVLRVKGESEQIAQARLLMFYCSRITLGNGLRIIGIEALKEM